MERVPDGAPQAVEPEYEVVWPLGRRPELESAIPPPLPELDGKTIALLWDNLFRGDEMFDLIADELRSRYPNIRFVGHEEYGNIHGANEIEFLEALPGVLREQGVDGAVVAVAA